MSTGTIKALHGFAVSFYILAVLGFIAFIILAASEEEWLFFGIGLGSGIMVTWFGLVLDGLSVIAKNTARYTTSTGKSDGNIDTLTATEVSEELPEL